MGRPRKFKEPKNQTVIFDATELELIREEARRMDVSISAYIRRLSLLGVTLMRAARAETTRQKGDD